MNNMHFSRSLNTLLLCESLRIVAIFIRATCSLLIHLGLSLLRSNFYFSPTIWFHLNRTSGGWIAIGANFTKCCRREHVWQSFRWKRLSGKSTSTVYDDDGEFKFAIHNEVSQDSRSKVPWLSNRLLQLILLKYWPDMTEVWDYMVLYICYYK